MYHETKVSEITELTEKKKALDITFNEGYLLWKKITERTVLLTENYRATDKPLAEMLEHVRVGNLSDGDMNDLQEWTFENPNGPSTSDDRWRSAILITTRNIVRQAWNN